ncbi:MAG: hypothetical protein ABTD50_22230 [Polyangiaceae bacterium]
MKKTSLNRAARRLARCAVSCALTLCLQPAPLFAQEHAAVDIAQARELYNEGSKLRDKGDVAGSIEKFQAAYALAATPIIGLDLGKAYMGAGKLVDAREALLAVGRLPRQPQETARSLGARDQSVALAEKLRTRIPTLRVRITGVPASTVAVTIDGAAVPVEALGGPRLLDPGAHQISARSTTGGTAATTVTLAEAESREIELKLVFSGPAPASPPVSTSAPASSEPAPAPATPAAATGSQSGLGPLVYIGFGVAAGGLIVGSVTGAMAMSKASSVSDACSGTTCPTSVDSDLQSGRTLGDVSTIAFAVAGAGAVAGVVGLVLAPHARSAGAAGFTWSPWVGVTNAGVRGTF